MIPAEFLSLREHFGLSQAEVARFLGKGERIIRKYEHGDSPVPRETEILLRLMRALKLTPEKVKEWIDE